MRKTKAVLIVMMMSAGLSACDSKDASVPATKLESAVVTTVPDETAADETKADEDMAQSESGGESKVTLSEKMKEENTAASQENQKSEASYEDNFAVDTSAAAAFADKVKAAVAAKDMDALADLTAFPVYVGIAEDGVETREDFMALGAEKVFTPELTESIEGADTSNLQPSMAGFSISKDGGPNIIFGVVNGKLAISGINYQ